ncbi:hypothetical protein SELMODRAFT_138426 [Selaginella moellendorffii]|uniref:Uncharacterized protein n=1 Tax=Selaginella moellendorffii TaxID=88036 RepID=D8TFB8_SELML|nr:hypothetical protein SELMODRAFT_138426 [Selaginella moellendorffii]
MADGTTAVNYPTSPTIPSLPAIGGVPPNSQNPPTPPTPTESMPPAANTNSPVFPVLLDDTMGQSPASSTLAVAAADSAMGPAIPATTHRTRGTMAVEHATGTKG